MAIEDMFRRQIALATTLERLAFVLEKYIDTVVIDSIDGKETIALRDERVLVQRIGSLRIEIRPKEQCHNIPHFHLLGPDIDGSFAIDDCRQLAGKAVVRRTKRNLHRFFNSVGGRERLLSIWQENRPTE